MLRELRIKNLAIIEDLSLSFSEGLNILSGETGAGKSIIIGALTLLLGGKASPDMIRSAEEATEVEALFDVGSHKLINHQLEGWGIAKDESLLMKRVISRTGKSKSFINGNLATLQMLGQLGVDLISISGQHEHQTLLQADKHIDVLDEFGSLLPLREQVEKGYRRFLDISRRLNDLEVLEREKVQRKEFLNFQLKEIGEAHLGVGEEEKKREERRILSHAQRLIELSSSAYDTIYQNPDSAIERLRESLAKLKMIVAIDYSTNPLFSALETTLYQTEELSHALKEYSQKISFDTRRLEEVEARLDEIDKLKKKYGGSFEDVLRHQKEAKRELEKIESNEEELTRIKKEKQDVEEETLRLALSLSQRRGEEASILSAKVENELGSLGMKKTIFKVRLVQGGAGAQGSALKGVAMGGLRITDKGSDVVEFLVGPNPGEGLRPIAKVASGGELSRIILALKRIVSRRKGASTLIFDEVDSGIGGATAEVVGAKLKGIARQQQTLCITHLPQIASFADQHQSVFKKVEKRRTTVFIKKLDSPEEREEEIARMLGGTTITAKTRVHAREMLKLARRKAQEAE